MPEREAKPPWSDVPRAVKDEVARILGSPVARAERAYGGYAPSATFRVVLRDRRRAFLKSTYPLPAGSGVIWGVAEEERAYRALRSEEHTSELQSPYDLVCRLLLE